MDEVSSLDSFHTDEVEESETVEKTEKSQNEKINEDFEQVSSDEFENEENSVGEELKETSQNDMEVQEEDAAEGDGEGAAEREAEVEGVAEEAEECEDDAEEAQQNEAVNPSASADFEEVDANTSSQLQHSNAADESDMLGDNDMTLGNSADDAEAEAEAEAEADGDDKSTNTTEVDNMGEDEHDPDASNDVEMASNNSSPVSDDKNKNQLESADNAEAENEAEAEAEDEVGADESLKTVEGEANDATEDKSNDNDDNEDEGEHGADTVENVQEPEESDICLIPDDTEAEVTEAEKEQAILARENAEKEDNVEDNAEPSEAEKDDDTREKDSNEKEPVKSSSAVAEDAEGAEEEVGGESSEVASNKIIISWMVSVSTTCIKCETEKICEYRYKVPVNNDEETDGIKYEYLCTQECCALLTAENPGKYFIRRKKFLVEEVNNTQNNEDTENADVAKNSCVQCKEEKVCKLFFKQDDDNYYICSDECFELLNTLEPDKFKLKRHSIRVRNIGATLSTSSKQMNAESHAVARTAAEAEAARQERMASFTRRCADCLNEVTLGEKSLLWESMDFCNELCLGKYQRKIGSHCQTCNGEVPHQALGKYCVRFGFDVRQFCCAPCLNEYKKGLKTCSCCQKDISKGNEGFLAPVGDKEQFKDFCSQSCMRRYDNMCNPIKKLRNDCCAVCNNEKPVRVEIVLDNKEYNFCSNPCFSAFKFVSNIVADQCGMCCKYFERKGSESFTIYTEKRAKVFCSKICLNVYIIVNRRIVSCQWCKVKKYNFDMIYNQRDGQEILMCSLNCLTLYGVSITAFTRTIIKCDNCNTSATPQYHLTMSDTSMRNFCTYQCVMQFQNQFSRTPLTLDNEATQTTAYANKSNNNAPFPTGLPKRIKLRTPQQVGIPKQMQLASKMNTSSNKLPIISTVSSLATGESEAHIGSVTVRRNRTRSGRKIESPPSAQLPPPPLVPLSSSQTKGARLRKGPLATSKNDYQRTPSPSVEVQVQTETKIITVPPLPPKVRNVQTSCKPQQVTVGLQVGAEQRSVGCQTDKDYSNKVLIPVPVPIYVPQPMYMYSAPFPVPVPIPLPIPVPVFIPTTRNSAQGILKEIKKIQDKMPADPFEAELLMMAEMVAEEKAESDSDSAEEPEDIKPTANNIVTIAYGNNNVDTVEVGGAAHANHGYGEDVLQMALKMATGDYDAQPTVDLESAMTANTITNPPPGIVEHHDDVYGGNVHMHTQQIEVQQRSGRGRKRGSMNTRSPVKRQRLQEIDSSLQQQQQQQPLTVNTHMLLQSQQEMQPLEKPDAAMCLKYTFGVNAWRQWVMTKNAEIEKSSMRRKPFKTDLLQMTADELNYSLCLFIKEVRKPNGAEYAPDTIYYLVLGLQQYLYENGRIDNIFTDSFYERFTDCLDDVARKFSVLYNDSQYIVTRVEEEHLWECKQLGAHSPHVLLSTLMFFNTKHFNLTTVEEHMQLSFSHIMKHWKRSGQSAKVPGTRNVLLRFYPPQTGLDANPRKKKVYEQQENEENPLRCPVRLYEFYLSKCPESVKTRNDVFYLQPERSCVPDSPVWYSTQALSQDSLQKMLHRVKMVKEINIALLTS